MQSKNIESREFLDFEPIDFQKYWQIWKRRWRPAMTVFVALPAVAVGAAFLMEPVYRAQAQVLIKADRTSSLVGFEEETGTLESANNLSSAPLENQAVVIQSPPVAQQVILSLNLRDDDGELLTPESFLKKLDVNMVKRTDVINIIYEDESPEEALAVVSKVLDVYIQKNITANRAELVAAREFIAQQLPQVEASVIRAERALADFRASNNIVSMQVEAQSVAENLGRIENELTSVTTRATELDARVTSLQEQLGMGIDQATVLAIIGQSSGVQSILSDYQAAYSQLSVEKAKYAPNHPKVLQLQNRVDALESVLVERVSQTLNNDPEALSLALSTNLETGQLRNELVASLIEASVDRNSLLNKSSSLENLLANYRDRARQLNQLSVLENELQRQLNAAQETYQTLLSSLKEVQVAENQTIGNVRVISDPLLSEKPVAPSKRLFLAAGMLSGSLLAVLVAFGLDLIDPSIKTVKDIQALFGYKVLGIIPTVKPSVNNSLSPFSRSFAEDRREPGTISLFSNGNHQKGYLNEAFELLYANFKVLCNEQSLRAIIVTSSIPGEGKSTVVANLAVSAVNVGQKVLVIDADMRSPAQDTIWQVSNSKGLSDVVSRSQSLEGSIHKGVLPGMDILTAGGRTTNPLGLINSEAMSSLVKLVSSQYDLVLIDSPPIMTAGDASTLGKIVDGVLLVAQPRLVDHVSASAASNILTTSKQNVVGIVANNVNSNLDPFGVHQSAYHQNEHNDSDVYSQTPVCS